MTEISGERDAAKVSPWSEGLVRLAIEVGDRVRRLVCRSSRRRFYGRRELLPFGVDPLKRARDVPVNREIKNIAAAPSCRPDAVFPRIVASKSSGTLTSEKRFREE